MATDPICGMMVAESSALRAERDGTTYYFCSQQRRRTFLAQIPRAVTSGETRGFLKAVVDAQSDRILGASILMENGGEVMSVIHVAMRAGLSYTDLRDLAFAHPTMAEGLNDLFARLE